ncbi:hypothetical protein [Spirosoma validum]|uniref:Uncharacterized protein n=1 Tax=Spirosoma validum TaxID=2771355 RepID=A0A927B1Z9_9BACT|nr:hypothetical protein [Spirosoma validum]MBD2753858.1 hypothetical protein [Spirosoma validum]
MSKKSVTDTTLANFRRRFPTTNDLVAYLLANKPDRSVTADQLYLEVIEKKNNVTTDNTDLEIMQ